jgi:hypothetical protein
MPEFSPSHEFSHAWHRFVNALRKLWSNVRPPTEGGRVSHYAELSQNALKAAVESSFVDRLRRAWLKRYEKRKGRVVADLFLDEISSFANAVDAFPPKSENYYESEQQGLLADAGTILGSLKDLFKSLPPWVKATITLLREVADILKGG